MVVPVRHHHLHDYRPSGRQLARHRRSWVWKCAAGPIVGIPAVGYAWWTVIGGGVWPGSETGNALPNQSGVLVAVPEPSTLWLLLGWLVGAVIVGLAIGRAAGGGE